MKFRPLILTLVMLFTFPAYAEYRYQLILPPDAHHAYLSGINNAGKAVGIAADENYDYLYGFEYDMNRHVYTILGEDFNAVEINNAGLMVGNNLDGICTILDKHGEFTPFFPPSYTEGAYCEARGVNPEGQISGMLIDELDVCLGFIFDSESDTYEEFMPSWLTIANGINAQGQNVGAVYLPADHLYTGFPEGIYDYLREPDGAVRYFVIDQSYPGESWAQGISENGLISGHFVNEDTWEYMGFVIPIPEGDDFTSISLADNEILHVRPCDPNLPPPPNGWDIFTDVLIEQVRNDGLVVGQCTDYHVNWNSGKFKPFTTYGLIATPIR